MSALLPPFVSAFERCPRAVEADPGAFVRDERKSQPRRGRAAHFLYVIRQIC